MGTFRRHPTSLFFAAALLFVGCSEDRGGDGTTRVCGPVASGGTCAATMECACGLSCVAGACLRVVSPAIVNPNPNVRPPTAQMTRICNEIAQLPCGDDDPECATNLAEQRAASENDGCGPQFDGVLDCVDRNPLVCDGNDPEVPAPCQGAFTTFVQACNNCVTSSGCESRPSPQPNRDAGTSTTTPTVEPCRTTWSESCSDQSERGITLDCVQASDGGSQIWVCTCVTGSMSNKKFGIRSSDDSCCSFGSVGAMECGAVPGGGG